MESVLIFLQTHIPELVEHKYLFLFIAAAIEGLSTMVLGGFLVSVDAIRFWPAFAVLVIGHSINGTLWYLVGRFAGSRPIDRFIRNDEKGRKVMDQVDFYFHKYSVRAIIITKFTLSLTIATSIMAGSLKYNFKRFSLFNFIGSLSWTIVPMSVGMFFGQSYQALFKYALNFMFFVIFLAAAITLTYVFKYLIKNKFVKRMTIAQKLRELGERIKENIDEMISEK